ncbi:hypothetical protein [Kribbella deserti]|uniref:Uncharacterized protein n=1 Tax=Kribbella deserti TaxID=1926257 RepID=A0ABV6QNF6_9ACTN
MTNTDLPIADYDWVHLVKGNLLHHPKLTPEQHQECEESGGIYNEPVTLDCGIEVTTIMIPGMFTRMGAQRCPACCAATGLPPGKGSPKNDDECRKVLGL